MKALCILGLVTFSFWLTACGGVQQVRFAAPEGAQLRLDGKKIGVAPLARNLERSRHTLTMEFTDEALKQLGFSSKDIRIARTQGASVLRGQLDIRSVSLVPAVLSLKPEWLRGAMVEGNVVTWQWADANGDPLLNYQGSVAMQDEIIESWRDHGTLALDVTPQISLLRTDLAGLDSINYGLALPISLQLDGSQRLMLYLEWSRSIGAALPNGSKVYPSLQGAGVGYGYGWWLRSESVRFGIDAVAGYFFYNATYSRDVCGSSDTVGLM